jgi:hypothetical protein
MGALQPLMLVLVLVGCALQLLLLVLEGAAQAPARLWEHLLVLWKHLLVLWEHLLVLWEHLLVLWEQ